MKIGNRKIKEKKIDNEVQSVECVTDYEYMLDIDNLSKRYLNSVNYSVQDLTIKVKRGEIFGFLGQNGAGKSTTIKCLTGYFPFDKGEITICGHNIKTDAVEAKMNLGYVPDSRAMFDKMTGFEYINFIADLHDVDVSVRQSRIDEMEARFKLGDSIYSMISSYSHGMRQKICLMASLIHRPKLWLLDEPLTGLDAVTIEALLSYMIEYKQQGNGILFCSHNLDVVDRICDRVYRISQGHVTDAFTMEDFRSAHPGESLVKVFMQDTEE